jgi:hypothetical protein
MDAGGPLETFVLAASGDEVAAHAKVLEAIAKESRGTPVWDAN